MGGITKKMIKKALCLAVILIIALQGAAFAADSKGEIIARDAAYGAGIGLFLGLSIWLIDPQGDSILPAIGIGLTSGTVIGLAYGVAVDSRGLVSIEKEGVKFAMPDIKMERTAEDYKLKAALLSVKF